MLRRFLIVAILSIVATGMVQAEDKTVTTIKQTELRNNYPFPLFQSTGPYIWYENAEKQPTRGHMFRVATFTVDTVLRVYIEKWIFGVDGCCHELVESYELKVTEADLAKLYPANRGRFHFKLLKWRSPTSFIFTAFGGQYLLTDIDTPNPKIAETTDNE